MGKSPRLVSGLQLQNPNDEPVDVEVLFASATHQDSVPAPVSIRLEAAESRTLGLSDQIRPDGTGGWFNDIEFRGSAVVNSTLPITAMVNLAPDTGEPLRAASALAVTEVDSTVNVPLAMCGNHSFDTILSIQDASGDGTRVEVDFYRPLEPGEYREDVHAAIHTERFSLSSDEAIDTNQEDYCDALRPPSGGAFVGSAKVRSLDGGRELAVQVLQVGNDSILAYNGLARGAADTTLYAPLITSNHREGYTAIQIQNTHSSVAASVRIEYGPNTVGDFQPSDETTDIGPGQSVTMAQGHWSDNVQWKPRPLYVGNATIHSLAPPNPDASGAPRLVALVNQCRFAECTSGSAYEATPAHAMTRAVSAPLLMHQYGYSTEFSVMAAALNDNPAPIDIQFSDYQSVKQPEIVFSPKTIRKSLRSGESFVLGQAPEAWADLAQNAPIESGERRYVGSATAFAPPGVRLAGAANIAQWSAPGDGLGTYPGLPTSAPEQEHENLRTPDSYNDFAVLEAYDLDGDLHGTVFGIGNQNEHVLLGSFDILPENHCSIHDGSSNLEITHRNTHNGPFAEDGETYAGFNILASLQGLCSIHYKEASTSFNGGRAIQCDITPVNGESSVRCFEIEESPMTGGFPLRPADPDSVAFFGDEGAGCLTENAFDFFDAATTGAPTTFAELAEATLMVEESAVFFSQQGVPWEAHAFTYGVLPGSESRMDDFEALCITKDSYEGLHDAGVTVMEDLRDPATLAMTVWDVAGWARLGWTLFRGVSKVPARQIARELIDVSDDGVPDALQVWKRRPRWNPCPAVGAAGAAAINCIRGPRWLAAHVANLDPYIDIGVRAPLVDQYAPDPARAASFVDDIIELHRQAVDLIRGDAPSTPGLAELDSLLEHARIREVARALIPQNKAEAIARNQYITHATFVEELLAVYIDRLSNNRPSFIVTTAANEVHYGSNNWIRSILEAAFNDGAAFQKTVSQTGEPNTFALAGDAIADRIRVIEFPSPGSLSPSDYQAALVRTADQLEAFFRASPDVGFADVSFQIVDDAAYSGKEARSQFQVLSFILQELLSRPDFVQQQGIDLASDLGVQLDVVIPFLQGRAVDTLSAAADGIKVETGEQLSTWVFNADRVWIPTMNGHGREIPGIAELLAAQPEPARARIQETYDAMLWAADEISALPDYEPVINLEGFRPVFALAHKITDGVATVFGQLRTWDEISYLVHGELPLPPYRVVDPLTAGLQPLPMAAGF